MRDARLRPESREVDDRDGGHLRARARGGRQRDERMERPRDRPARSDRWVDVVEQLAAVCREERAQLRGVKRRATADPDEAVEPVARCCRCFRNRILARLADEAVEEHGLNTRLT